MNGKIYKVSPSITKEEILKDCHFEEIPDYGDVMTYESFMNGVDYNFLTDWDGSGYLVLYDKVVRGTSIWIHKKTVFFVNRFFVPLDVVHSIFGDNMKIIWFNK